MGWQEGPVWKHVLSTEEKKNKKKKQEGLAGTKLPLASISCFLQIATSRSTCGPHIDLPCGKMFQFLSGLVFLCHPGFKDFPSFCAFPPFFSSPLHALRPAAQTYIRFYPDENKKKKIAFPFTNTWKVLESPVG